VNNFRVWAILDNARVKRAQKLIPQSDILIPEHNKMKTLRQGTNEEN